MKAAPLRHQHGFWLGGQIPDSARRSAIAATLNRVVARRWYGPIHARRHSALDDGVKINSLSRGFSGIRLEVINFLISLVNAEVYPCVPKKAQWAHRAI